MKTTFLVSAAALFGALALGGAAQAQDASGQQNDQSASIGNPSDTSGYGGVSGSTSASGIARSGWATCGHESKCNPDSGH